MLLSKRRHARAARAAGLRLEQVPVCARATRQGKIDTSLLNQMSAMASAQGYSLTNKVWQLCNGWLMEAKRANGSPAILYVEPRTQTIVDVDSARDGRGDHVFGICRKWIDRGFRPSSLSLSVRHAPEAIAAHIGREGER
jgi:hypothetical protein